MPAACPVCGFDGSSLRPADAAVALRSFPRRYRELLVPPDDDQTAADAARRPGAGGWSATDHAAWAAAAIVDLTGQLREVLIHDQPQVAPPPIDPGRPPSDTPAPAATVDRLAVATSALATLVEGTVGEQWKRTGASTSGAAITALDLVSLAVHQGIHHLRAADQILRELARQT